MGMTGREFAFLEGAGIVCRHGRNVPSTVPYRLWVQAAFFAQLIHHPVELTLFPANMVQGPVASAGFP